MKNVYENNENEDPKGHKNHDGEDPGTIKVYLFKIDERPFESRERYEKASTLLGLAGKNPEHYALYVDKEQDEVLNRVYLSPSDTIDLGEYGIEFFVTKLLYMFYIEQARHKTTEQFLTVRAILEEYAEVNPDKKTLAEKQGEGFHSYKNLDEKIDMSVTEHHFTLFDDEPVTKS